MAIYIDANHLYCRFKTEANPYGKPTIDYKSGVKVLDMIENQPTADVVEVVRCKDCKHYVAEYCTRDIKSRTNMFYMAENDFCSYGERSSNE